MVWFLDYSFTLATNTTTAFPFATLSFTPDIRMLRHGWNKTCLYGFMISMVAIGLNTGVQIRLAELSNAKSSKIGVGTEMASSSVSVRMEFVKIEKMNGITAYKLRSLTH